MIKLNPFRYDLPSEYNIDSFINSQLAKIKKEKKVAQSGRSIRTKTTFWTSDLGKTVIEFIKSKLNEDQNAKPCSIHETVYINYPQVPDDQKTKNSILNKISSLKSKMKQDKCDATEEHLAILNSSISSDKSRSFRYLISNGGRNLNPVIMRQ